jgi:hypothetical protein
MKMRCLTISECERWRERNSRPRDFRRQITCITPLDRLPWFSGLMVDHLLPFDDALLIVDKIVFEPVTELESIRHCDHEPRSIRDAPGHLFEKNPEGLKSVLKAALSEWIDLRLIFSSPRYALLADHDEYTTFFSQSPGRIANVRRSLEKGGVTVVEYMAKSP